MPFSVPMSIAPGRCVLFLICLSLTVILSTSSSKPEVEPLTNHNVQFVPRQIAVSSLIPSSIPVSSTPTSTSTSSENPPSQQSTPPKETPTTTTTSTTSEPSPTQKEEPSTTPPPQTQATQPPGPQLSSIQSTGSDGSPTVIVVTVLATSSTSSSPTPTPPPDDQGSDGSSGLGTGSIIGLSVAGGIALLGIAAFFIWKFTRKHRSATYDDGKQHR